jgi:Ecdysteroid kinase-like family
MARRPSKKCANDRTHLNRLLGLAEDAAWSEQRLQSLWGGYGQVSRLTAAAAANGSSSTPLTVIVKHVKPPTGQGGVGHERKVKSYKVEAAWYSDPRLAKWFLQQQEGSDSDMTIITKPTEAAAATLPYPISISTNADGRFEFELSDVSRRFPRYAWGINGNDATAVLKWMAAFHATYWECELPCDADDNLLVWQEGINTRVMTAQYLYVLQLLLRLARSKTCAGLQAVPLLYWQPYALHLKCIIYAFPLVLSMALGSYWHLQARWDEYDAIGKEFKRLKFAAKAIDHVLTSSGSKYRTLVHGDCKADNILLADTPNGTVASLHDYQVSC